jgi:ELWxxDGT repeat protein
MRNKLLTLTLAILSMAGGTVHAQTLLKDLEPGNNVGSGPHQLTLVDGTLYFFTDPSTTRRHALWKTDGTEAGTVMVKDSFITTPVAERLVMRGVSHDTLYFTVNTNVQGDTTTELWMVKNGSAPLLVTELTSRMVNQFSNGEPRKFAMAGGKLFFQMYTAHGYELWVSNGTASGTHEVADLFPGSTSGIANGGTADVAMGEFNGKIYFQGLTSYSGVKGVYSSDGNTIELVKEGPDFNPSNFTVFNNSLYFYGAATSATGLWKSDGTTAGTVNVTNSGFNGDAVIFKNMMYYNVGNSQYKTDGTTAGTVKVSDTIGSVYGKNNDYIFSRKYHSITTPPYIAYDHFRSDGTAAYESIVDSLGSSASFTVLNNKMYGVGLDNALRESDGTAAGVKTLVSGIISSPTAVNNKVVFSNFGTGTGYEPWVYVPSGGSSTGLSEAQSAATINLYPNPSTGLIQLTIQNASAGTVVEVYNIKGERVYQLTGVKIHHELDLSDLAKGMYFVKVNDGVNVYSRKLMLQ